MELNVLDLFSGTGNIAFECTGFFKTIAFVEKDKFCQKDVSFVKHPMMIHKDF